MNDAIPHCCKCNAKDAPFHVDKEGDFCHDCWALTTHFAALNILRLEQVNEDDINASA